MSFLMAANDEPCCKPMFWIYLVTSAALVIFAGLMSGLTVGLMSLSQMDLEVLSRSGQPKDRKNAAKILPIVKNQHLLVCTLLLGKTLAIEALPIFLDSILPPWAAILISVTLILAFGEIIPQAVCSRYGLSVGAKMVMLVKLLLLLFFPITYPISKLLDWLLGKGHFELLRRAELKTLVDMHGNAAGKGGELSHDETTIITGALDLTQKTAKDAMTPISKTFSLDINSKLNMHTIDLIMTEGHSRVPIYSESPTNVIGLILVKNLIAFRPEDETPIRNVTVRRIPRVPDHLPLYDILNAFQEGHSHMAVVVKGMKDVKKMPENTKGKSSTLGERMNTNRIHTQAEQKGRNSSSTLEAVTEPSPVYSGAIGTPDHNRSDCLESRNKINQLRNDWDQRGENVINADLNSLPRYLAEEEVVGIITMEDVIEELLQEEIYDETDQYVDIHNKKRINMLSPRRSSPRFPRVTALSHFLQGTSVASSVSSYHHTAVLHSPISPYIQSPDPRPSLSNSPAYHLPSYPADLVGSGRNSSPSNRVSRKPYEKLHKVEGA